MALQTLQKESIKPGEWHDVLWHHYMNCVDSLRSQAAESSTIPGFGPTFKSHPSFETFEGNVRILEAMCQGYGFIDDAFVKLHEKDSATSLFAELTKLLKTKDFWKEGRPYLGRI